MASRPGSPSAVRMGMRARSDERAEKDGGRFVGGGDNGRKPLVRETVKGASFAKALSSVGMMGRRGKVGDAARDPMLNLSQDSFEN